MLLEWIRFKPSKNILLKKIIFKKYPSTIERNFFNQLTVKDWQSDEIYCCGEHIAIFGGLDIICEKNVYQEITVTRHAYVNSNKKKGWLWMCNKKSSSKIHGSFSPFASLTIEWEALEFINIESISFEIL